MDIDAAKEAILEIITELEDGEYSDWSCEVITELEDALEVLRSHEGD